MNTDIVTDPADQLGRPAEARIRQLGRPRRSIRAPPTRRIQSVYAAGLSTTAATPTAPPMPASSSSRSSTMPATSCRSTRQGRAGRAGHDPDRRRLGLQRCSPGATALPATRQLEVVVPSDVRRRRRLHPGDQRLRAASERRQALDGVPLFGRRPARLARGLLPPDPLQRHRGPRRRPAGAARQAPGGRELCQGRVPDARRAGRGPRRRSPASGTPSSAPTSSKHGADRRHADKRPARLPPGRPLPIAERSPSGFLCAACASASCSASLPFIVFAVLFLHRCRRLPDRRRRSSRPDGSFTLDNIAGLVDAADRRARSGSRSASRRPRPCSAR